MIPQDSAGILAESMQNGVESTQNGAESTQNGAESMQNGVESAQNGAESVQNTWGSVKYCDVGGKLKKEMANVSSTTNQIILLQKE